MTDALCRTSFSVSPSVIYEGECCTIAAGNAYEQTANTAIGTYTFVAVHNTLNTAWVSVYAPVTVTAP